MKRRSRAGGEPNKAQRRKTPERKRSNTAKAVARSISCATGEETEVARLTRELNEALERQAATSEVLQVISGSPGDLEPAFAAMLEKAVRICDATFGNIYRWDGEALHLIATHNTPPAFAEALRRSPSRRMMVTKKFAHIADAAASEAYAERHPATVAAVELGGIRSVLTVPMLKDNELIGTFALARQEVRPFSDKQIALLESFASQAVIAIENARLLNELRQRTTDLTEALEQQTATSDVLSVISASSGELRPVFQVMLQNATRICEAKFGVVFRFDGNVFHVEAQVGTPPKFADYLNQASFPQPLPGSHLDRLKQTKRVSYTVDYAAEGIPAPPVTLGGARSTLDVPMLKDDELIGAFSIYRQEVRPFTDKQIALVKNFADQAVIAIENARLLNELRQSLDQQTATSEVLQVISSSPGDLEPVFASMLENAVRICDATFGNIYRWDGDALHLLATHNTPPAFAEARKLLPARPTSHMRYMVETKAAAHVADFAAGEDYIARNPGAVAAVELGGVRTFLAVPMLKENEMIGSFSLYRQEVRPFTDKQIALVTNFAAQAVIAIENARLLNELRQRTTDLTEALEQQTATSDVLQVISSSPGDLHPVFTSMLENAVRICAAAFGHIYRWDGDALHLVATRNTPPAFAEARKRLPFRPHPKSASARMLATKKAIHVADLAAEQAYNEDRDPAIVTAVELGGVRTALAVPMVKENELIGAFTVYRQEVRPFSDKQIALLENFAAQAVIAIENARLLKELRERTEQIEAQSKEVVKLNQQLEQRVADQVGEIERMGRLRRFLPPQVADLIVASGAEKHLESHRREITALFCDLRGFTGFTEISDAEDVMALLRDYHAAFGEIIIKYGGTLERYAGDGVDAPPEKRSDLNYVF
jgi:two-component system, NtrC family, sensor kinase